MTRKDRKRRTEIIKILSDMSRDWGRWTSSDWSRLEKELASIEAKG